MAWRPYENLIEAELDNTVAGKVRGWIRFVGMDEPVRLKLEGDFHRDIRGARIHLGNPQPCAGGGVVSSCVAASVDVVILGEHLDSQTSEQCDPPRRSHRVP